MYDKYSPWQALGFQSIFTNKPNGKGFDFWPSSALIPTQMLSLRSLKKEADFMQGSQRNVAFGNGRVVV